MMIYLASPYSHPDEAVREARFRAACVAASVLMNQGHHVYSPIAHTHPIAVYGGLPLYWEYWKTYDEWFISRVDKVVVLRLDGWDRSTGVKAEIEMAMQRGILVDYVDP